MKKRILSFSIAVLIAATLLGGCSILDEFIGKTDEEEPLINGTTTGNILNYGFAVKDGESLIFLYTGAGVYEKGSVVRSNVETGENSLVLDAGGLYLNIVDDVLYYCRPEGVYKAPLETGEPSLVLPMDVSLLQISDGSMYYISGGVIGCTTTEGEPTDFSNIEDAACLNIYEDAIYYIDTNDGTIWTADMDGTGHEVVYEESVDMFYLIDDVIYFIDSADGYIKRMRLTLEGLETVVEYPCSGFNINFKGMYYTRNVDGKSLCCNAGTDGYQETVIEDFGESAWHIACMFGEGAVVIKEEDIFELLERP